MSQLFTDINRGLCDAYTGLNPIELLYYPAEDVFNLINSTIDYNNRNDKNNKSNNKNKVIRKKASDNWF